MLQSLPKPKNLCDIINQFYGVATLLNVCIKYSLVRDHGLGGNEHWRELRHQGSSNNHVAVFREPLCFNKSVLTDGVSPD